MHLDGSILIVEVIVDLSHLLVYLSASADFLINLLVFRPCSLLSPLVSELKVLDLNSVLSYGILTVHVRCMNTVLAY